jgi:phage terminase large subunit-like protein
LDENPIMRFCLRNVEIRRDLNGNEKPNKASDKKKIDGVIAALQALAVYSDHPNIGNNNIY